MEKKKKTAKFYTMKHFVYLAKSMIEQPASKSWRKKIENCLYPECSRIGQTESRKDEENLPFSGPNEKKNDSQEKKIEHIRWSV